MKRKKRSEKIDKRLLARYNNKGFDTQEYE
jgi:hypothetical protein